MKANELRIGNYVYDRGNKLLKIEGWENESKVFQSSGYYNLPEPIGQLPFHPLTEDVEFLKPILLTEEWLLKFGFVEDDCFGDNFLRHKKAISITVSAIHSNGEIHIQIGNYPVSIRYVHQLQNLYFALKSEELTLSK